MKRELYQRQNVPEHWKVDLDARLIERWRPDDQRPEIVRNRLEWLPEGVSEPLAIEVPAFFAESVWSSCWTWRRWKFVVMGAWAFMAWMLEGGPRAPAPPAAC